MFKRMVFAAMLAASVSAVASDFVLGEEGSFYADMRYAGSGEKTRVAFGFFDDLGVCDSVMLVPLGFRAEAVSAVVDGTVFAPGEMVYVDGVSAITVSDGLVAALKHGGYASFIFDGYVFGVDLAGSAGVITAAWRACESRRRVIEPRGGWRGV